MSFEHYPSRAMPPSIVKYLGEIDAHLVGRVPQEAREEFVGETEFWLDRLTNDLILQGLEVDSAVDLALRRHGPSKLVSLALAEQWFEQGVDSALFRKVGRANSIAGALFGMGNLVVLILVQIAVFLPSDITRLPFSPAVVRSVLPEPVPLPELTWQFTAPIFATLLAPILLGAWAGWLIPVRAHAAVYRALCPIVLSAFMMGCLLLPNTAGLLYAIFQTAFWLPVGCACAHLSSSIARYRRARQEGSLDGTHAPQTKPIGVA